MKINTIVFSFLKKKKKIVFITLAAIIIAALIFIPIKKRFLTPLTTKYETTQVKKQDLTEIISASGNIQSENQVDLKFQTSGLLSWVGVQEGDKVKKWQAIASLDQKSLKKSLEKKMLAYMNERWDFEQTQDDYQEEKDNRLVDDAIKRILEKAQFDLESSVLNYEISDLTVKLATIVSPIEGIVTHIDNPVAGINITPASAVFTIADPNQMKFIANIDEVDIGRIKEGQKVKIMLDAYLDQEFESVISKVAFASVRTSGGGTAYPVEIKLPVNINLQFRVGINGDVDIIIDEQKDVLNIPFESVIEKEGKKMVQVIEGKNIKKIEVKTGIETDTKIQITKGLEEGQIVIVREKRN